MKKKISIEGMSCGHCVRHVEEALKEIGEVASVEVSLEGKYAIVELSEDVADAKLKEAVEDAGYDVTEIKTM
ncbi:MAG TPA: heavy-metal-associated domain-containing protein [Clostridiales bacterium]|nr:heavy-metal-associated domain-containing protein [Clostridiales bacterium]